jgi:hypothetical protein
MAQTVVPLNPKATYLRSNQDTVLNAAPILLSSLGASPGDLLRIRALGEFAYNTSGQTSNVMCAVFSSSATLLASSVQARVPGAIDAGVNWDSGATYRGSLPTDIPEDFLVSNNGTIGGVLVSVPAGAVYIFVGTPDSLYEDNTDLDNDYAAELTRFPGCVADVDDGSGTGTPDGGVGIEDLLYYLTLYEAGTLRADVDDGSGTGIHDGGVGIEDLLYYLTRFDAGC